MMSPDEAFPRRLRHARLALGLTQAALARQIGMQRKRVCILEHGTEHPNVVTLAKLAQALAVTTDWLLGLTETPQGTDTEALGQIVGQLSPSHRQWLEGLGKTLLQEQQAMQQRVQGGQVGLQAVWNTTGPASDY